ncbi:MAG: hypothetical protein AB7V50_02220 [Vampirovibrionia bacterium]
MEPIEIKLEKNVFESSIITETPTKSTKSYTSSNNSGMSFEDFMTDQLSYEFLSTSKSTKTEKEESNVPKTKNNEETANIQPPINQELKELNQNKQINKEELESLKDTKDIYLNLDGTKITKQDIENIQNLATNTNFSVNINQINGFNNTTINYNESGINSNTLNFSKNLSEALQKAYKSNQPIRIEIEKDTSVIIKIDKEGKVSAHFISSDKAMEMLLRDHIYQLRDKLDREGLPYKSLSYNHQSNDNKKDQEDKQNQ